MAAVRKLELMHKLFGRCEGHTCRECTNFVGKMANDRKLKKCAVYGNTSSEASDWAGRWLACGMFGKVYTGLPVIRWVRLQRQTGPKESEQPLEGQMRMEV